MGLMLWFGFLRVTVACLFSKHTKAWYHALWEGGRAHMGSCQNYGPFLGTLNRCRIIIEIQKGTIILTTTHI